MRSRSIHKKTEVSDDERMCDICLIYAYFYQEALEHYGRLSRSDGVERVGTAR